MQNSWLVDIEKAFKYLAIRCIY